MGQRVAGSKDGRGRGCHKVMNGLVSGLKSVKVGGCNA